MATIVVAVVAGALVATGLVLLIGNQAGNPAGNQNPSAGKTSSGISLDQATSAVQSYLGRMGYSNLATGLMQEYSNMYYAQIIEQNNGTGDFELSVNRNTGAVSPMQGPTLMWNMKYGVGSNGMMGYLTSTTGSGGMMGGGEMMTWLRGTPTANMAISMQQAKTIAQQYPDANYTGTTVGQVTTYYGYYTMQILKDGNPYGMMAVYGNNGQLMYYSSMGTFMQEKAFG